MFIYLDENWIRNELSYVVLHTFWHVILLGLTKYNSTLSLQ